MELTVLTENTPAVGTRPLVAEHGLSLYFEADGGKWLVDVGAGPAFAENADALGIRIEDVDVLILSHAHADHTGGLRTFLRRNSHARIYLSAHIGGRRYFSTRHGVRTDISPDETLFNEFGSRFHFVGKPAALSSSVSLLTDIPAVYPLPKANGCLWADGRKDDFNHEMAVRVREKDGTALLSSCSHRGLLNTLEAGRKAEEAGCRIKAYVGGLHLPDSDGCPQFETEEELRTIARMVRENYPGLTLYTGHCTGDKAKAVFSGLLGERFRLLHTGLRTTL